MSRGSAILAAQVVFHPGACGKPCHCASAASKRTQDVSTELSRTGSVEPFSGRAESSATTLYCGVAVALYACCASLGSCMGLGALEGASWGPVGDHGAVLGSMILPSSPDETR